MDAPLAYLNGRFLPYRDTRLPVWDYAVVQGATVTDMVRTFRGEPFRLPQHLQRFAASRAALGIELPESEDRLAELVQEVLQRMQPLLPRGCDCGVLLFATPGEFRPYAAWGFEALLTPAEAGPQPVATFTEPAEVARPTLCIHPFPLAFARHHAWYTQGAALAIPQVRQVPARCLPPDIKYRSRLHWYLAERDARRIDPQAAALLLDEHGCVTETNTGNLFIVRDGQIITPRAEVTLGGISQHVVTELAAKAGFEVVRADLPPASVQTAEEAFLSSTTYCLAPVTRLDGHPIADGRPGPIFRDLIARWSAEVGVDIPAQAAMFRHPSTTQASPPHSRP